MKITWESTIISYLAVAKTKRVSLLCLWMCFILFLSASLSVNSVFKSILKQNIYSTSRLREKKEVEDKRLQKPFFFSGETWLTYCFLDVTLHFYYQISNYSFCLWTNSNGQASQYSIEKKKTKQNSTQLAIL